MFYVKNTVKNNAETYIDDDDDDDDADVQTDTDADSNVNDGNDDINEVLSTGANAGSNVNADGYGTDTLAALLNEADIRNDVSVKSD